MISILQHFQSRPTQKFYIFLAPAYSSIPFIILAMPNYRRNYVPGGTFFFTIVTNDRIRYFNTPARLDHLLSTIHKVQKSLPFDLIAWALIPNHIHLLIKLPEGEENYSIRMREIKRISTLWMKRELNVSKLCLWQEKFWEHTILDQRDLEIHFNYIHYNPVKHGLSQSYDGWKWSSFSEYYPDAHATGMKIDPEVFKTNKDGYGE